MKKQTAIKARRKRIKIPIYFGDLILIQVDNEEESKKICEKYDIEPSDHFEAFCFSIKKNRYLEYYMIFEKNFTPKIIAHESLHVVRYIYQDRGMSFETNDNDEHQCYLLGWIVNECHKFLN